MCSFWDVDACDRATASSSTAVVEPDSGGVLGWSSAWLIIACKLSAARLGTSFHPSLQPFGRDTMHHQEPHATDRDGDRRSSPPNGFAWRSTGTAGSHHPSGFLAAVFPRHHVARNLQRRSARDDAGCWSKWFLAGRGSPATNAHQRSVSPLSFV